MEKKRTGTDARVRTIEQWLQQVDDALIYEPDGEAAQATQRHASSRELNGIESVMGFLCWLLTREEAVTFSCYENTGEALALLDVWRTKQALGCVGDDWPDCLASMA